MELHDILSEAWKSVEKSGVPEALHEAAFKEALAFLREGGVSKAATSRQHQSSGRRKSGERSEPLAPNAELPSEAEFFTELAKESGVSERDLRDVLQLTKNGTVHVTPATKDLGSNLAEQARTVVALVANARAIGLRESPVNADAVRAEVSRKRCMDSGNFSATVVGRLKGVNRGASNKEFVTTSRWVDEFRAAVDQALGRAESGSA